jgi:hypothetical protein
MARVHAPASAKLATWKAQHAKGAGQYPPSEPHQIEEAPMDPNANLREQEQLVASYAGRKLPDRHDAARLRYLRKALRAWLTDGGFEPDWAANPRAARYYKHFREYLAGAKA